MGLELDEDKDGNVFIKSIEKGGRAEKTGLVFVGDYGNATEYFSVIFLHYLPQSPW